MIRVLLILYAVIEVVWSAAVPNPGGNYIAALINIGAAAGLDLLNTRWHQRA